MEVAFYSITIFGETYRVNEETFLNVIIFEQILQKGSLIFFSVIIIGKNVVILGFLDCVQKQANSRCNYLSIFSIGTTRRHRGEQNPDGGIG